MKYEILGEIRVHGVSGVVTPRTRKTETLLAVLLAKTNQMVTSDQLLNEIWGEDPPSRANDALYVYISQLRKVLRGSGHHAAIVTRPRGYTILTDAGDLDADEFRRLAHLGQQLRRAGQFFPAAQTLRRALLLWGGPAFSGLIDSPVVYAYATLLNELRIECMEQLMEIELTLGGHREIVGQLSALITEQPLREKLYQYLMLALHRSDRRAEALAVFHTARQRLDMEIGIEPCQALRDLHQHILQDRDLGSSMLVSPLAAAS
ncbi:AfsR/SARP family transcriptional regulator [Micromonospora sp.]|uniref:AfsR/SARP family transcriptional regulator n=1 Tax=unclassified Micromonospora TaxID=2617518 RepID=UPI003B3B41C8